MRKLGATIFVCILADILLAQVWDGVSTTEPQLASATYTITSGAELAWLAQQSQTNSFEGYTFVLSNDIDLGEGHNWTPIGGNGTDFQGTFDGNCHTIKQFNIFYSQRTADLGFFGTIGTKASVKNLAIESGRIFVSDISNVGCIAGRNDGTVSHCFGMIQILANSCNNVGGLIGLNNGVLTYAYQAGYISDAGNNSGGLTGSNNGQVSHCYVSGYTLSSGANCGSVTGINNGSFADTYFDQQMCLQKASTKDESGITAITETTDMFKIFSSDSQWLTMSDWYPQLACFAATSSEASVVSVIPIMLKSDEAPIQRAEAMTKNFRLCTDSNTTWTSSDNMVISISDDRGTVTRSCSKRVIIATAHHGESKRGVLLQVSGYDTFDAGIIGGLTRACNGDAIKFSNKTNGAEIKDAVGGRDDDKKQYPYYYKIEQYQVFDHDGDSIFEDTVLFKTYHTTSNDYSKLMLDTEHDGHWVYRRYVHDSQCQLDFMQSTGEFNLIVFSTFDPGDLNSKTDTIYGDYPQDIHIESTNDAIGGEGPYMYRWYYSQLNINYAKSDTTYIVDSVRIDDAPDSPVFDTILSEPGEYYFYRAARDLYCNTIEYVPSRGFQHFVVFDSLSAGAISEQEITICLGETPASIKENKKATGGNGIYVYRWSANDSVIAILNSPNLQLKADFFKAGETYIITRQVKDNTGLMDWTDSEGEYTIIVREPINPGKIEPTHLIECASEGSTTYTVDLLAKNVYSDSTLRYRWLLYNTDKGELIRTFENNQTEMYHKIYGDSREPDSVHWDSIHYFISFDSLPIHFKLIRQASGGICSDDWVDSEGDILITIDSTTEKYTYIFLSEKDLPYTGTYTFESGKTETYKLTNERYYNSLFEEKSNHCNEHARINGIVFHKPKVEVGPIVNICEDESYLLVNYKIISDNKSLIGRIQFNDAAYAAGLKDIYFLTDDSYLDPYHQSREGIYYNSTMVKFPVNGIPHGDYEMYVSFIESPYKDFINGYYSGSDKMNFNKNVQYWFDSIPADTSFFDKHNRNYYTIKYVSFAGQSKYTQTLPFHVNLSGFIHQKWNDVLYIDNNDKNGFPNAHSDLLFKGYQWYKDGEPIEGATGQVYNEPGGLNGVYYAILTDTAGNQYLTCDYEVRPTGLDNPFNILDISPNILSQGEIIHVNAPESGYIRIISMTGQVVYSTQHSAYLPTDIPAKMSSGMYIISLTTNNGDIYHSHLIIR